jgi:hypothetical protein
MFNFRRAVTLVDVRSSPKDSRDDTICEMLDAGRPGPPGRVRS